MRNSRKSLLPFQPFTLLAVLFLAAMGQAFLAQKDLPWTLPVGLLLYLASFYFLRELARGRKEGNVPSPQLKWERPALAAVFLIALFFRLFRLDQFPAGIFSDEANLAEGALKIAREGWRPFSDFSGMSVHNISIYYLLALWFKLFPATQLSLFSASVAVSLAALPLLYGALRRLAGSATALTALLLIAVLRWHVTYSRDMHPAGEILLYIGGTLYLWLVAVDTRKAWAFLAAGAVMGLGAYSYQAYRAFPIAMGIFLLHEWLKTPLRERRAGPFALFILSAGITAAPVLWCMLRYPGYNERQDELMAFPVLFRQGWGAVAGHLMDTFLAFSRAGDIWMVHNIPGHRLLDDGTGLLWMLGLALGLLRWRERRSFYALIGTAVMALPAFLSVDPAHASRLFGCVPFVALSAAEALVFLTGTLARSLNPGPAWRTAMLPVILLGFCGVENFHDYFEVQAKNPACWRALIGAEVSWVGRRMAGDGDRYSYVTCPRYFGSFAIGFLDFDKRARMYPLKLPEALGLTGLPRDKGVCFILDEGHTGLLNLIQTLYPGGETETFRTPEDYPIAYLYRLPAFPAPPHAAWGNWGLHGDYCRSRLGWMSAVHPALIHRDLLLNFTFRDDFPLMDFPPLWVDWSGSLLVPQTGTYRFLILTTDEGQLTLDGKLILPLGNRESADIPLGKGPHRLVAFYGKVSGVDAAFSLLWKRPGEDRYEVVPSNAFRTKFP